MDGYDYPAPDGLDDEARSLWLNTITALIAQGTFKPNDVDLVGRYVRADRDARELRKAVGTDWIVKGSRNNPRPNPALRLATDCEKQAMTFARELLLTPAARKANVEERDPEADELADLLG